MADEIKFPPLWGEWHLKDRLGKGAFGSVYRAEKTEYGNTYISAIKHLPIPPSDVSVKDLISEGIIQSQRSLPKYYDHIRDQIINEINMCYALRGHTNIVSYEDHCIIPRQAGGYDIFIRMEFLTSLPDYMHMHTFTYDDVIHLGIEMCSALSVLNKHHMIHRDIKPANIFINAIGEFKLGDFGESKVLSGSTVGMTVRGTFNYMSPEISMGRPANITADIYSLGIVLYRLLNGNKSPFVPVDAATTSSRDIEISNTRRFSGERLPLPHFCDDYKLAGIIMKACEFDPSERWQTPEEMKYAFEELLREKRQLTGANNAITHMPFNGADNSQSISAPMNGTNNPMPQNTINEQSSRSEISAPVKGTDNSQSVSAPMNGTNNPMPQNTINELSSRSEISAPVKGTDNSQSISAPINGTNSPMPEKTINEQSSRSEISAPVKEADNTKSVAVPASAFNSTVSENTAQKGNNVLKNVARTEQVSDDTKQPIINGGIEKVNRKKKKWLIPVVVLSCAAVVAAGVIGGVMIFGGSGQEAIKTQDNSVEKYESYLEKIKSEKDLDKRIDNCKKAIESFPERYEAYEALLAAYVSFGSEYDIDSKDICLKYDEYTEFKNITADNILVSDSEKYNSSDFADNVYYNVGFALTFSCDDTSKGKTEAKQWLDKASANCSKDKKACAETYLDYCSAKEADNGDEADISKRFDDLVKIEQYAKESIKKSENSALNMLKICSSDLSDNITLYKSSVESEDEIIALAEAIEKDVETFEKKNSGTFKDETENIKANVSEIKKAFDPTSYLEDVVIDETKDYYADIVIENYGTLTVKLEPEYAPITVRNFIYLANSGYYNGVTFHRVIKDFVIQGGDPNCDGTGGSEHSIYGECFDNGYRNNTLSHTRGAVSMVHAIEDYNSANSQFFIALNDDYAYSLDGMYAVFGYVTSGMEIIDSVCESVVPVDDSGLLDKASQPVMSSVSIRIEDKS